MNKPRKVAPKFANEAKERAFWQKHDSTEYLDWTKAQKVALPNLKPTKRLPPARIPTT
jgi:CopG antitoxin of type II toxin-antitoxin system